MASIVYNGFKGAIGHDWAAGADSAYKWMLVDDTYTPNPDHDNPDDGPAAAEITGGSYARQNIATRVKTLDDSNDRYDHSANNPTFTGLTGPAEPRYLIGYRVVTNDTDHQLVCCLDLGAGQSVVGDFTAKLNGGASSGVAFRNS